MKRSRRTSELDSALAALRHYVTLSHDGLLARQSTSKLDSALAALRHYVTLSHDGLLARQSTSELDSALAALRHCQGVIVNHYIAVYTDYQAQRTLRNYFCQGVPLPLGRAKQPTETLNDAAS